MISFTSFAFSLFHLLKKKMIFFHLHCRFISYDCAFRKVSKATKQQQLQNIPSTISKQSHFHKIKCTDMARKQAMDTGLHNL